MVLRDGGTAQVRPITPEDAERLVAFYEKVSDESKYHRFFAPRPRLTERDVRRFTHHDYVDRVGLAAVVGGEFIATVRYDRVDGDGRPASAPADEAEVAFLVQDAHQGRGVASALLEHIAACARERGIRRFTAEVLPGNTRMLKVFTEAGYTQRRTFADGTVHLTLDLEPTVASLAVRHGREQRAEARSVQRLLAPRAVAVIGAGRRPGGTGRTVLRTLLDAGFTGRLYAVNRALPPGGTTLDGVPAHPSVRDLPEPVDLAVVAVPADQVPQVVTDCGACGVQGLVVLSAGHDREEQRALVRQARAHGMRIVGPNALGIVNTAPEVRLNATPASRTPRRGRIGLFTQSGAIGIALLSGLHQRGAGVSSFVSAGNRADVSGNDVLQYWHEDPETDVALMYLESFGNPRKFARLARRTAADKPIVVVRGGRHSGGVPPAGHAAPPLAVPDATVTALLRQAGVIPVDTVTELIDVGLLLERQPLPGGPRVAVLGNSESLGLIAHDTCLALGLSPRPPLDLTTSATAEDFHRALSRAVTDPTVDAVLVTVIPAVGELPVAALADALHLAAAAGGKPVAVAHLAIEGLEAALTERRLPGYPAPERAVWALAQAVRYARWRRQAADPGRVPDFQDIRAKDAGELVARALPTGHTTAGPVTEPAGHPDHTTTLPADTAAELLACYGIHVLPALPAPTADAAVRAARRLGGPVALKTTAPRYRHRPDLGGVRLDLAGERQLRRAFRELTESLGPASELRPVVQPMAPRGVDTMVRARLDPSLGTVLSFGLAGPPSELLGDTAHRLVPVTDREAAALVRSLRASPLLFGWRGARPVDTDALEELLLRLSRLVDGHPEVVDVTLEPVVVAARGVSVLGASVRLAPRRLPADLGPRRLTAY